MIGVMVIAGSPFGSIVTLGSVVEPIADIEPLFLFVEAKILPCFPVCAQQIHNVHIHNYIQQTTTTSQKPACAKSRFVVFFCCEFSLITRL